MNYSLFLQVSHHSIHASFRHFAGSVKKSVDTRKERLSHFLLLSLVGLQIWLQLTGQSVILTLLSSSKTYITNK